MSDPSFAALQAALRKLAAGQQLAGAVAHLRPHARTIHAELKDAVLAAVPAFTESRDPATLSALAAHGPQHLAEMLRLLEGAAPGGFPFEREHARLWAERRFPLEALLHAYRCEHKVLTRWLRQAAVASSGGADGVADLVDFAMEYSDVVSTIASTAYVDQARLLVDVAGDQRAQLLNILLNGYDESDARVAAILRGAGYLDGRQTFCVVLAQPVDATEMDEPARARRLADAIDQLVPRDLARRLVDVRDACVVAVFSGLRRASGWTVPSASLARRIARALATAGNGVLIGVSNDVVSTAQIPTSHRQALLALRMASRTRRVVPFSETALRQLMIHLAGEELQHLLPPWSTALHEADEKLGGALVATLRAYADADMNLLKAAARLELHPNTVYARLNRIRDITGLNARGYNALTDLLTVADAHRG